MPSHPPAPAAVEPLTGDVITADEAELAALAYRADAEVRARAARIRSEFVAYGAWLRVVYENALFRPLGYETWESYLADPEVNAGLHRRHLYRMVRIARAYHPGGAPELAPAPDEPSEAQMDSTDVPLTLADVAAMGVIKADMVAGVISDPRTTPEERAEWAAKARSLTVGDLRTELRAARMGREEPQLDLEVETAAWLGRRLRVLADRLDLDSLPAVVAALTALATEAAERVRGGRWAG